MMIYRRETRSSSKWLLALLLLVFVLTFTLDEAYGLSGPSRRSHDENYQSSGSTQQGQEGNYQWQQSHNYADCHEGSEPTPNAVPEPTTILLVGAGLTAAMIRRKMQR